MGCIFGQPFTVFTLSVTLESVVARVLYQDCFASTNRFSFAVDANAWPFGRVVLRRTRTYRQK